VKNRLKTKAELLAEGWQEGAYYSASKHSNRINFEHGLFVPENPEKPQHRTKNRAIKSLSRFAWAYTKLGEKCALKRKTSGGDDLKFEVIFADGTEQYVPWYLIKNPEEKAEVKLQEFQIDGKGNITLTVVPGLSKTFQFNCSFREMDEKVLLKVSQKLLPEIGYKVVKGY